MTPVDGSSAFMNCSTPTGAPPRGAMGTVSMDTVRYPVATSNARVPVRSKRDSA